MPEYAIYLSLGLSLSSIFFYLLWKRIASANKNHLFTPTPPEKGDPVDDLICLHCGDKTIVSRGDVTVVATKRKPEHLQSS